MEAQNPPILRLVGTVTDLGSRARSEITNVRIIVPACKFASIDELGRCVVVTVGNGNQENSPSPPEFHCQNVQRNWNHIGRRCGMAIAKMSRGRRPSERPLPKPTLHLQGLFWRTPIAQGNKSTAAVRQTSLACRLPPMTMRWMRRGGAVGWLEFRPAAPETNRASLFNVNGQGRQCILLIVQQNV